MKVVSSNSLSWLGSYLYGAILFLNDTCIMEIVHESVINKVVQNILLVTALQPCRFNLRVNDFGSHRLVCS